ncbi:spermidine/putrescine ABC transporter, permease protein [Pseudooceanicola batsensis HTCC2597]|uniref:Spermidine/putrescine ABC transporter, permease protein n=1 Tax=Pseudooceanicola batsensis (strain ATCC BAA-863 / DSM 15984 / KCTC 12145 / HTCC2597) TaxID=252305 RepID=A3U1H4_PSEBH|nr:ABC transporter permease [Pseudooceanicola batsensis]EAQ02157.1 spermidine/putrescine ABC transporter, permease protein [Pseudooceanicola batsensis HTCC2597]
MTTQQNSSGSSFHAARRSRITRQIVMGVTVTAIYAFLLTPILIIILSSFNTTSANTFPADGLSLQWYREFLESPSFLAAFQFSAWLGVVAAVGATVIGFLTAYGIIRYVGSYREVAQSIAMLPIMVPHILISISLLILLTVLPIPELAGLIIGHIIICLPFTVAGILASLDGVDPQLERAAWTLGASRLRILWEVVIPLVAPGLFSSLIFAFIISFGDVYIALFLSGPGMTTLPIEIFSYMQWESTPVIAAITTVQIIMIFGLGLIIERLVGLRQIMRI